VIGLNGGGVRFGAGASGCDPAPFGSNGGIFRSFNRAAVRFAASKLLTGGRSPGTRLAARGTP